MDNQSTVNYETIDKQPLVTGHRNHDDLIERLRIERANRAIRRTPLYPQAMIYLVVLGTLVGALLFFAQ
jgi:hypothetical protein